MAEDWAYLRRIRGGEDFSQPGPAAMFFYRDRPPLETVSAGRATGAANRAKQIVPCGMIVSAGQASVARLGSDGSMRYFTALDKAFENHDCIAAILLEPKNRLYEPSQCLLQPRLVRWKE